MWYFQALISTSNRGFHWFIETFEVEKIKKVYLIYLSVHYSTSAEGL